MLSVAAVVLRIRLNDVAGEDYMAHPITHSPLKSTIIVYEAEICVILRTAVVA